MDQNTTFIQDPFKTTPSEVNNSCSSEIQLYINEPWVEAVFASLYMVIFVVGMVGNLAIIGVILGNKHMRTTVNIYLVNLAASDMSMCFVAPLNAPVRPFTLLRKRLVHGEEALCKLISSLVPVNVFMSTFTLTAIAVDRYRAVFYPFSVQTNTLTKTVVIILCIDLFSTVITLPYSAILKLTQDDHGTLHCGTEWTDEMRLVYFSFATIVQFAIPLAIVVFCYTRIMIKLRHREIERSDSMTTHQIQEEAARTNKMNKLLISITVIFVICWFPINMLNVVTLNIVFLLGGNIHCWELLDFSFMIAYMISMLSTCYNPFVYGWLNTAFRAEFVKLCSFCVRKHPNRPNGLAGGERIKMKDLDHVRHSAEPAEEERTSWTS